MEVKVVVPPLGESVVEGTVVKWLKQEGEQINVDEPLVEIMTDKINVEIPSGYKGTMKKILVPPETVVGIGQEIAIIEAEAGAVEPRTFEVKPEGEERIPKEQEVAPPPEDFVKAAAHHRALGIKADEAAIEAGIEAVKSSPLVRRLAHEHFIDLRNVTPTGKDDRITKEDVLNYIELRHRAEIERPGFKFPGAEEEEVVPITGVRKVIWEHMTKSAFTIPHVTTFDDCDMTELAEWRQRYADRFEEKHGVRITFMPFIAKAVVYAARDYPWINATVEEGNLHVKKYFNIGMAVARQNSLIVPIVKHCEQKSILEIAREMRTLGEKANQDKLSMDEITGGTFTLTNAGVYGATASTPIIAYPQVAVLGVHKIQDRAIVRNALIVVRSMMTFCLSFDHRVVDGAYAVQFLRRMIDYLEDPQAWLVDVI